MTQSTEDVYIDLKVTHTIKLCMHDELIAKGFIVLDSDGDYSIVEEKYRDLIDYVYENSSDPIVDLTIGD
tara:strand:- start:1240 stop:1449 length:210 start_codon:yes stop_codon:yes gene_type:complete